MESTESNGRSYFFKPGNQYGVGHGRPKGGKKLVRAALAGKLDAGRFAEIVGRDLAAAERGDFRALVRYAKIVRLLAFSDGVGRPKPWNAKSARQKRN